MFTLAVLAQMSALYTIEWPKGKPSLAEAAAQLHVPESDMDEGFGVVPIDPAHHLYAVRVTTHNATSAAPQERAVSGPYSDPKIEGFGPPR
jgi:hypothetical protein